MIRKLALASLLVCLGSLALSLSAQEQAAPPQPLSAADKTKAMDYLQSTRKNLNDAVKGLSDAQLNFKSAPDRWSIAEVVEHIGVTEDGLRQMVIEKVMVSPAAPGRDLVKIDELVLTAIPDRSHKAQAPDPFKPTNRFGTPAATTAHFNESRDKTEQLLQSTPGLRDHAADSPLKVQLDAYEWILFIGAHSERHTKQILEVKADPNFPKS